MKSKTIKVPHWEAWKNLMPGPKVKAYLFIRGCVFSYLYEEPYLEPLEEPIMFELRFRNLPHPPYFPKHLLLPKSVDYQVKNPGVALAVLIRVPYQKKLVKVPIKIVV